MDIILLENIRNLGPFGKKVKVAKGYGRNFLIPQGKAVPATARNVEMFESQRHELAKAAEQRLTEAQARAANMESLVVEITARAAEEGKLYGSVSIADIVRALEAAGHHVVRQEVRLPMGAIRDIGEYTVELHLHAEVVTPIVVRVVAE